MEHLRLHRAPHRPAPELAVAEGIGLRRGRVHEICGAARRSFAVRAAAAAGGGPLIWIRPAWQAERLNPDGVCEIADPVGMVFVDCSRAEDILWCLEETLRAGAVALAVAELPAPPGLTPVRRLHLAAEAGAAARAGPAPTGLVLVPGDGGAAGIESRWHVAPAHDRDRTAWRVERRRARHAPPAAWMLDAAGDPSPVAATA